jgi:exopolysaccharide production protein ExoY
MADGSSARERRLATETVASVQHPTVRNASTSNVFLHDYSPPPAAHRSWRGKRILDVCSAIALTVFLAPAIIAITTCLLFTRGPIIFGHQRVGKNGQRFTCYKFRTMVPNAEEVLEDLFATDPSLHEEWVDGHKLKEDPRVTRFGAFLRKTSLDELPQLWNVIRGEMSLVGPRPIVDDEIFRYGRGFRHYVAVKPGLTGMWQVSGRTDTSYQRRVAMDRLYAMRSCMGLDLKILIQTAFAVFARRGAY